MRALALLPALGLLVVLACGGVSRPRDRAALLAGLESADPSERAWAVAELTRLRDPGTWPGLVARLRDEDGGIRLFAGAALREQTGEDLGFRPFDPPEEREAAVRRWEAWLARRGEGAP